MTEIELLNYALNNGCSLYQTTAKYYKVRKNGTPGVSCMSGIEKVDDNRILDNTYIHHVCLSLCIDPPNEDPYSRSVFLRFWKHWKDIIKSKMN